MFFDGTLAVPWLSAATTMHLAFAVLVMFSQAFNPFLYFQF